jgi:hypothetical protein
MNNYNFTDKKIKKLIHDICIEHWDACRIEDSNMGYLWYMYASGPKKNQFKPFIFLSELNLLLKTGYVTEVEKQNMLSMLLSEDQDNANITAFSIITFRNSRIKKLGIWTLDNDHYKNINYKVDIVSPDLFSTKINFDKNK